MFPKQLEIDHSLYGRQTINCDQLVELIELECANIVEQAESIDIGRQFRNYLIRIFGVTTLDCAACVVRGTHASAS